MEVSKHDSLALEQKLFTLGEFYIKKGNYSQARDVFSRLVQKAQATSHVFHSLGKIEFELGNMDLAILHLEKAREMNPFYKPTLLLLYQIYEYDSHYLEALKCMVDLYLLSKETEDEHTSQYRKKIRNLVKKITPEMDTIQKNLLIRERNQHLNRELASLESFFTTSPEKEAAPTPAKSIPSIKKEMIEKESKEDEERDLEKAVLREFDVDTLNDRLEGQMVEPPPARITPATEAVLDPPVPAAKIISHAFEPQIKLEESKHILFRSLYPSDLKKIQKFSTIQTFEKNQPIHQPMDLIFGFTCILDGKVQVLHQDLPLVELEGGSIVDEAEMLIGSKYFFETRALEKTSVLIIDKPALLTLCKNHHELGFHFLWHFYKSLCLKINAVFDNIIYQNPSKDVIWSLDLLQEFSQNRKLLQSEVMIAEKLLRATELQKGEILFKSHAPINSFYILLEGQITLEHPLSGDVTHLQQSEYFSDFALISNAFEHALDAKIESDSAKVLSLDRMELNQICDFKNHDNYQFAEILWKVYSWKYFEFLNFYYHLLKSSSSPK